MQAVVLTACIFFYLKNQVKCGIIYLLEVCCVKKRNEFKRRITATVCFVAVVMICVFFLLWCFQYNSDKVKVIIEEGKYSYNAEADVSDK